MATEFRFRCDECEQEWTLTGDFDRRKSFLEVRTVGPQPFFSAGVGQKRPIAGDYCSLGCLEKRIRGETR
jgi:hypothetical protein